LRPYGSDRRGRAAVRAVRASRARRPGRRGPGRASGARRQRRRRSRRCRGWRARTYPTTATPAPACERRSVRARGLVSPAWCWANCCAPCAPCTLPAARGVLRRLRRPPLPRGAARAGRSRCRRSACPAVRGRRGRGSRGTPRGPRPIAARRRRCWRRGTRAPGRGALRCPDVASSGGGGSARARSYCSIARNHSPAAVNASPAFHAAMIDGSTLSESSDSAAERAKSPASAASAAALMRSRAAFFFGAQGAARAVVEAHASAPRTVVAASRRGIGLSECRASRRRPAECRHRTHRVGRRHQGVSIQAQHRSGAGRLQGRRCRCLRHRVRCPRLATRCRWFRIRLAACRCKSRRAGRRCRSLSTPTRRRWGSWRRSRRPRTYPLAFRPRGSMPNQKDIRRRGTRTHRTRRGPGGTAPRRRLRRPWSQRIRRSPLSPPPSIRGERQRLRWRRLRWCVDGSWCGLVEASARSTWSVRRVASLLGVAEDCV
jgi:hypothetical protein